MYKSNIEQIHKAEVMKVSNTVTTRASRKESLSTVYKSVITDHVVEHNHVIGREKEKVIGMEQDRFKKMGQRGCRDNKEEGRYHEQRWRTYQLSHIFDALLNSPSKKSPKEKGKPTGNSKIATGIAES